jgi:hypothetical protein
MTRRRFPPAALPASVWVDVDMSGVDVDAGGVLEDVRHDPAEEPTVKIPPATVRQLIALAKGYAA